MTRSRIALAIGAAALLVAGGGVLTAMAFGGPAAVPTTPIPTSSPYPGYAAMLDGTDTPQWMIGGSLPGPLMMGGNGDPGKAMGRWLANAPGTRISAQDAARLADQAPAHAAIDRARHRIVFTTRDVRLTALAGPADGPDETFRIAGMVNPTIVVPIAAQVTIQLINADPDMAHGLVITNQNAGTYWMPMMATGPTFTGAAVWALGDPTTAGLATATLTFTADRPGTYDYLCAVPGHAEKGMIGAFLVQDAPN